MNWKLVRQSKNKFVVESDGKIAAHMDLSFDEQTVYLDFASVEPAFRGSGVGNFLVRETIALLKLEAKKIVPVCGYVQAVVRKNSLLD
jgi:predicted GNAT family acetyltransferase